VIFYTSQQAGIQKMYLFFVNTLAGQISFALLSAAASGVNGFVARKQIFFFSGVDLPHSTVIRFFLEMFF